MKSSTIAAAGNTFLLGLPRERCYGPERTRTDRTLRHIDAGKHAALPGVKLWFIDTGVALVRWSSFCIPTPAPSRSGKARIEAFTQAGYRVIAFDRRGWGKSLADPASGPQPGSIAEDLHALSDHLALNRFHLIGVAGGGFAALDYAAWHPERVRSLVVGASTGSFEEKDIADFIARIAIPEIRKQPAHYREIGASYRGANPEGTKRWIEIDEHSRQPGVPFQPPLRTPNTFAKIATIPADACHRRRRRRLLAPPALMRVWAAHIKHHEWTTIEDAGHAMAWERPAAFNAKVLDFATPALMSTHGSVMRRCGTSASPTKSSARIRAAARCNHTR